VIVVATAWIASFYQLEALRDILPVLGVLVVTEATIVTTRAFLYGLKRFGTIAALSAGTSLLKVLIVTYLLITGATLQDFVQALVILLVAAAGMYLATALAPVLRFGRSLRLYDRQILGKMLGYCLPLLGARAAYLSGQHLNKLILGSFLPAADVGYFGFAFTLVEKFVAILYAIPASLLPTLTSLRATRNFEKLKDVFWQTVKLVEVLAVCLGSFVFLFAAELALLLGGREFLPSLVLIKILALTPVFRTSQQPFTNLFYAYEKTKTVLVLALLKLGVEVLFYIILLPRMGVPGAALGTLLAFAACFVPAYAIGVREVGPQTGGAEVTLLKGISLLLIIAAFSMIVELYVPAGAVVGIVKCVGFLLLAPIVLFGTGAVAGRDLERVSAMEVGSPVIARAQRLALPALLWMHRRLRPGERRSS
jgi:O-antigen/teichoic acid export membrane protein